jgi:hypothetical protein
MTPMLHAFLAHVLPGRSAEKARGIAEDAIANMVVFNLSWGLSGAEFERGAEMLTVVNALDEMVLCAPRTKREPHFQFTWETKRAIAKSGALPWLDAKQAELRAYLTAHGVATTETTAPPVGEMATWAEPGSEED